MRDLVGGDAPRHPEDNDLTLENSAVSGALVSWQRLVQLADESSGTIGTGVVLRTLFAAARVLIANQDVPVRSSLLLRRVEKH